jgi:arylsulfatase A-like enzyme
MGTAFLNRSQYARNAGTLTDESKFFSPQVFSAAVDWLDSVDGWDRWFCYVDSFDVHEPFHCPEPYASMYTGENPADPDLPVWPHYGRVDEGRSALTDRELDFIRSQFAGTVTMVDKWFGRLLDALDDGFWGETMVVVTSDHGFFLGDSGWIGKNDAPVYDRLGRTPLLVWDPDSPRMGERIPSLTSAVDLYATALETLGIDVPAHVHSRRLIPLLRGDANGHRDWALYGYWGRAVNVTDGRFTYLHPCDGTSDTDCYSTTMLNPNAPFVPPTPKHAESGPFLPYTDAPVWRFPGASTSQTNEPLLYDTESDPDQRENLVGTESTEHERMRDLLVDALETLDAPTSQYDRLDLNRSQSGSKQQ